MNTPHKIPTHNDSELLNQWRDLNRSGEGCSFGDADDLTCEADIYEAALLEGAHVLCALDTPDCYLVEWAEEYYVVCDCNGWWACRVSLLSPVSEPVGEPADMDLVETAFDQHWRRHRGACMIEISEFKSHQPRDLDAYTFNGSLYYSDGSLAWSIALEYLD